MKTGGGVIALIAGIFSIMMAFLTLGIGGLGSAFGGSEASTVIALGWAGLFLSFAIVVFAVICIFTSSNVPPIALIGLSLVNVFAGGTLVAIFMILALIGGILALAGNSKQQKTEEVM